MTAYEVNFDGLVGPTHNYAGLSYGNVASMSHKAQTSNPREAARQGLAKMKALADLGLKQGVIAPHVRPDVAALRALGFAGDDAAVLARTLKEAPELLAACSSASPMWTANAATVSPGADTADGRVHFTAANLSSKFHRSLEHQTTSRILRGMFPDGARFAHHAALPGGAAFGDEGAANHTRLCAEHGGAGVEFFVYGRRALDTHGVEPKRFPARQTLEASRAVARLHGLPADACVFAQQNPAAIDAGAFHNDVVAVGNRHVLFHHELAFLESDSLIDELSRRLRARGRCDLVPVTVPNAEVTLEDAVRSYLFNSQLIDLPDGTMALVAPKECLEIETVRLYVERLIHSGGPISTVKFYDLRQSMNNGGGPACLRLRVVLSEAELAAANPAVLLTDQLHARLNAWVDSRYRDRLSLRDLGDPSLLRETETALDELTQILDLGSVYAFQR